MAPAILRACHTIDVSYPIWTAQVMLLAWELADITCQHVPSLAAPDQFLAIIQEALPFVVILIDC